MTHQKKEKKDSPKPPYSTGGVLQTYGSASAAQPRLCLLQTRSFLQRSQEQGWTHHGQGFSLELTSTSNLLPPLSLAPLPATSTPIISMPLTSPTTSFLPDLAHERATSPLFRASAFAFRSFTLFTRIPSAFAPLGNKRQGGGRDSASCLHVPPREPYYA